MQRYLRSAVAVLFVAVSGCAQGGRAGGDRDALMARDRAWAGSASDLDKFMTYVASDATVHAPGAPASRGSEAIRKQFGEMLQTPGFSVSWTPEKAQIAGSGDVAYTTGAYTMQMGSGSETGKYVTVWRNENGAWMVAEDIFNANAQPQQTSQHVMMPAADLKWVDAPPSLPPGSKVAVISGDPSQAQAFVLRAMVPAGYRVPPHWHPGVENLTILTGTVALGMGDVFNEAAMSTLGPGGFASLPAEMRHSFLAKTAATFQVHGTGPFVVNYVNPADDPRKGTR